MQLADLPDIDDPTAWVVKSFRNTVEECLAARTLKSLACH